MPLEWRKYINMDHDGDHFEDGGEPLEESPLCLDGKVRAKFAATLGYWPDTALILAAVEIHKDEDDKALAGQLRDMKRQFDANGGRGPELAEEIDAARIAQAVRKAQAKKKGK